MRRKEAFPRRFVRKAKKFFARMAFLVGAVCIGGYVYVRADLASRADNYEAALNRAIENGVPTEPSQMDRFQSVPLEQNAAPKYLALFGKIPEMPSGMAPDFLLLQNDPEVLAAYRPYVEANRVINAEVRQVALLPHCAFQKDWSDCLKILFSEYAELKRMAKSLSSEAKIAAIDGKWDLAIQDLEAMDRIAVHTGESPVLIGALVRVSIRAIATKTAMEMAEIAAVDDPSALARIRSAVAQFSPAPQAKPYLQGEAYFGYRIASHLSENLDELATGFTLDSQPSLMDRWAIHPPLIESSLVERANAAAILDFWNDVFELLRQEDMTPNKLGRAMDLICQERSAKARPWMRLETIMFPVFSQFGLALAKSDADKATALAAMDVLAFKIRTGRLPKTLEEANASAAEPYGDGRLRYVHVDGAFKIYSVGPNLEDNGGRRGDGRLAGAPESDDHGVVVPIVKLQEYYSSALSKKRFFEALARDNDKKKAAERRRTQSNSSQVPQFQ